MRNNSINKWDLLGLLEDGMVWDPDLMTFVYRMPAFLVRNDKPLEPVDLPLSLALVGSGATPGASGGASVNASAATVAESKLKKPDCATYKSILDGNAGSIADAVKSKLTAGSGVTDANLTRLAGDMATIATKGGDLGRALVAMALANGMTINQSNAATAVPNSNLMTLNFSQPLYSVGLSPAADLVASGNATYEQGLMINNVAWNPATVVAHELGHAFLGLSDPVNVIAVQNLVASSFRANGLTELTRTTYSGSVWPVRNQNAPDGFSVPSVSMPNPSIPNLNVTEAQTFDQFFQRLGEANQKVADLISSAGCK